MHTASGFVDGNPVNVLRDTGCSGIVVCQSKIDETNLTGKFQVCVLADGTKVKVPVAMIMIDTPYLSGKYEAWCMQSPVYDLIIGNVKEVRSPGNPDPKWSPVQAVETRQQTKEKGKPPVKLKVPEIVKSSVSPDEICKAQKEYKFLTKLWDLAMKHESRAVKQGSVRWIISHDMLFREFTSQDGKVTSQLIVPESMRETIIKLAHESIMSGHLATRRSVARVLAEFYWPGVQFDVKRFCQSCDVCQRTVSKGKVMRVPLDKMPLIEEPSIVWLLTLLVLYTHLQTRKIVIFSR
ncbi:hypothetical protein FSP39_022429 [Pinctada imbricata]|uniref:Integrase zinc-binding domain-containing protein n=1 Tax=Pinctada imbricata TaxID=66713 RepID=A0AA88XVV9_PINIB|nr:hypothetical protein FSP39_022429 [Pinctada imbricata]